MRVWQNAVAPEAYILDITPGVSGVDLSTVSVASLKVKKPDGTLATWAVLVTNQTSTTLRLTHSYVTGDVDQAGTYYVYAQLTIPAGTARSMPRTLLVVPQYGTSP